MTVFQPIQKEIKENQKKFFFWKVRSNQIKVITIQNKVNV